MYIQFLPITNINALTKLMSAYNSIYTAAKTVVFWDMEDCEIPDGLNAGEVWQNIIKSLVNKGYHGSFEIKAYGESKDDLTSSEIKLKHFSAENGDGRVNQILVDLYFGAVDKCAPSNVMLIMGDISQKDSIIEILRDMKSANYNVLLAQHQNVSEVLPTIASSLWLWTSLSAGEILLTKAEAQNIA